MSKDVTKASVIERARKLDDQAVVDLIAAMFQALKEDYISALNYLDAHPDEPLDAKDKAEAFNMKRECEDFTRTPLFKLITDLDGKKLLESYRKVG